MAITHHLTILATRATFERLSPEQFLHLDRHEKPVNCGVTRYVGNPERGSQGRLELDEYNKQHFTDQEVILELEKKSGRKTRRSTAK